MWRSWRGAARRGAALTALLAASSSAGRAQAQPNEPTQEPASPEPGTVPPDGVEPESNEPESNEPESNEPESNEPDPGTPDPEGSEPTPPEEPSPTAPTDDAELFGRQPLLLAPSRLTPEEEEQLLSELRRYRGPFAQGRIRLSVLFGGGTNFRENYLILGAGLGYFLLDGLEASLAGTAWLLGDPFIGTVTPGLNYVFYMVPTLHPYVGAFYRHYFIGSDLPDIDTYGARLGAYLMVGRNGFLGAGAVYERMFRCDEDVWRRCDQWYPEITLAFVF